MSSTARLGSDPPPAPLTDVAWQVRRARADDVAAIANAIGELLLELGGACPEQAAMEATARELIWNEAAGTIVVAEAKGALVGVLAASWQTAIHIPGRYALIQDLWVAPAWRSRSLGAALVTKLCELARELGLARIEVGLPRDSFAGLAATEAFYRRRGFHPLGPRMRLAIE